MKIIFSMGIGDAFCIDALFTQEFRESITEIYWACKYGKVLKPIFEKNFFYKNLKKQYTLNEDEVKDFFKNRFGENFPHHGNPHVCKFWHFKHDLNDWNHRNGLEIIKELFNIQTEIKFFNNFDFLFQPQKYQGSSFINFINESYINWSDIDSKPNDYILVHQSSDNRPSTDIANINKEDWRFIENLSLTHNKKVIIITDKNNLNPPLSNYKIINVFDLPIEKSLMTICVLCKYSFYYVGLDSFVGILCAKILNSENLYIKSHDKNINETLKNHTLLQNFFLPHNVETIRKFYIYQKYQI